jgi:hypothetical protein
MLLVFFFPLIDFQLQLSFHVGEFENCWIENGIEFMVFGEL